MEELLFDFEDFDDSGLVLSLNESVLRAKRIPIEAVIHLFFLVSRRIARIRWRRRKRRFA